MDPLRSVARTAAYAIAVLLSVVWIASALASLKAPLLDLGKAHVGDAIIAFAGVFSLSPHGILKLAHMLAGTKLLLGAYLFAAVIVAVYERVRRGSSGDEMLDLALFLSAVASLVAVSPVLTQSEPLIRLNGELVLCAMASGLVAFGRRSPVPATASRALTWQATPFAAIPGYLGRVCWTRYRSA